MRSSRSAPARTARSETFVMLPVASDARASIESVTTTPRKPSSSRSTPSMIGCDCEAMRAAVECRIARVPDHHERHAGVDCGRERRQVDRLELLARAGDRHARAVGVRGGGAEPGKVLRRRRNAAGAPARHRGAHRAARSRRIARERAARERRAPERSERPPPAQALTVISDRTQGARPRSRLRAHRARGCLLRRRREGWCPRQSSNRAPFLVDRDERTIPASPEGSRELRELTLRDDVATEEDHAGHAPFPQRFAHVLGRRRPREAENEELADLLSERQLVDLGPRAGRRPCRCKDDGDERQRGHERQPLRDPGQVARSYSHATITAWFAWNSIVEEIRGGRLRARWS